MIQPPRRRSPDAPRRGGRGAPSPARGLDARGGFDDAEEQATERRGLRRAGRILGVVGGGVCVVGVLAVGVFPTRIFLDQRAATSEAEQRLAVLRDQNEAYEERIERLQTDDEIERIAREQYSLVFPGEEAYAVLPAPLPPLALPEVWPFGALVPPSGVTDAAAQDLQGGA